MHINLLYNQLGIDIRELFEDPYLIPDLDPCFRDVTKIIMLILLNAATPRKALNAINSKAKEKDRTTGPTTCEARAHPSNRAALNPQSPLLPSRHSRVDS